MSETEITDLKNQIIQLIRNLYPESMSGMDIDEMSNRRMAAIEVMDHISDNVYSEGDWK